MTSSPVVRRSGSPRRRLAPVALLVLGFGILVLIIGPLHEVPVQDDWDYARTVRLFLERGIVERSQIAQAGELFNLAWGALFTRLAGFSFTTLRFSTLTLSLGALLVFYVLLGELDLSVPRRVLGAATLLVCPLFLFLSNSFMTDVPTLFLEVAALVLYSRALRRKSLALAVLASVCVALAAVNRQIGLVIGLAAGAYALAHAPAGQRLRWGLACGLLPIVAMAGYLLWLRLTGGETWAGSNVTIRATVAIYLRGQFLGLFIRRGVIALMTLGLYALPVWLAALAGLPAVLTSVRRWRCPAVVNRGNERQSPPSQAQAGTIEPAKVTMAKRAAHMGVAVGALVIAAVAGRLALVGQWMPYLTDVFTRQGLRPYLAYYAYEAGAFRPDLLPLPFWIGLTALAAGLAWLLFVVIVRWLVSVLSCPAGSWKEAERHGAAAASGQHLALRPLLAWAGLALAATSLGFSEFYERFLLLLLPIVLLVLLDAARNVRLARVPALLGLAGVALASVLLMWDYWGWMDLRWSVGNALLDQGIPADLIDGGYEWNAWHLYDAAIQEINQNGEPMSIAPWLVVLDPEYMLAFTPLAGYTVQQDLHFPTPFGSAHGHFYVLRRVPPSDLQWPARRR